MVQPQYSPKESLERVKLMMKYDTSKTLNENKQSIKEQAADVDGDVGEIMKELNKTFSDEQKIVDIIKKYNNKSSFQTLLNKYKSVSGKDLDGALFPTIKFPQDRNEYLDLKNHLIKTLGIDAQDVQNPNGTRMTFNGTSKTSAPVKTDGTKTDGTKTVTTPPELKDVKAFQDWLDVNAKGWALPGYTDGIINKGQNGRGYGTFGPRTQKAWATYKDQYLKGDTATGTPTKPDEIEQVDADDSTDLLNN